MPADAYSKKQVNRCGKAFRDFVRRPAEMAGRDEGAWDELIEAVDVIDWWRAQHAKPLARVNAGLRYYVRRAGARQQNVTQRLKRFGTIVNKLDRHPNMALTTMEDIDGVRVVLDTQKQVDLSWHSCVVSRAGRCGACVSTSRIVLDGHFIEVQLRTPWQDVWAQSVEEDTRRLRAGLKFGSGPADRREYYVMTSEFFAMRERDEDPGQEFMAELAKMFRATRKYFPDDQEEATRR